MSTREERREKFASAVLGSQRKFPWPWTKTAEFVVDLRKRAQFGAPTPGAEGSAAGERQKDEIIKGLVQVHQDQQASVAAAENEARTMRSELDTSRKQMNQIYQQLQMQQGQMQQMHAQAQQALQQARAQTDAVQQSMGPEIQKAQQTAAAAADETTRARIELSRLQQIHEQVRQSVLQYKANVMQAVSQDPVTLAEAQRLQQEQQQQMQAQMLQQQQAQAQGMVNAEAQMAQAQRGVPGQIAQQQPGMMAQQQPGMMAQASAGMPKTATAKGAENPIASLSRAIAGQGERAGFRRAIAAQTLAQAIEQAGKGPMGGLRIPFESPAGQILQKRAALIGPLGKVADLRDVLTDPRFIGGGVGLVGGAALGAATTKDKEDKLRNTILGGLIGTGVGVGGGALLKYTAEKDLPAAVEQYMRGKGSTAPRTGLAGAGLGALAGGAVGGLGTRDEKKRLQNALLGALAVGSAGGLAGTYGGGALLKSKIQSVMDELQGLTTSGRVPLTFSSPGGAVRTFFP